MTTLGKRIREIRDERNQSEFAQLLGVDRTTLGSWENDRHEPSLEILIHIARIGKVSLDWLCCNDTLDKSYTEERLYSDPQWQRFVNFAYGKRIDPSRLRNLIQDMFSLNQP